MSHLWHQNDSNSWAALPLALGRGASLAQIAGPFVSAVVARDEAAATIRPLARGAGAGDAWALLASPAVPVRVNGQPLALGVRVLQDRDEIVVGGGLRVFFSTERLPTVQPFPGQAGTCCARCKLPIEPGTDAVQCPQCQIWCHQSAEFGCWTYSPTSCPLCDQPTALDGEYRFQPEEL